MPIVVSQMDEKYYATPAAAQLAIILALPMSFLKLSESTGIKQYNLIRLLENLQDSRIVYYYQGYWRLCADRERARSGAL